MTLFHLLVSVAVALLAIAGLTVTGEWIYWTALGLVSLAAVVSLTKNDREL